MLTEGADPSRPPPDFELMQEFFGFLGKDLQQLRDEASGLSATTERYAEEPEAAWSRLESARLRTMAGMSSQALRGLENYMAGLESEMEALGRRQLSLYDEAREAGDERLAELEEDQAELDVDMADALEDVRRLLNESYLEDRGDPVFPDAPYTPDHGTYAVPPKEADTDEWDGEEGDAAVEDEGGEPTFDWLNPEDADNDEQEDPYLPQLGGPVAELDPRFTDDRPAPRRRRWGRPGPREQLASRQWNRLQELEMASHGLDSDQDALGPMIDGLRQGMRGMWSWNQEQRSAAANGLRDALRSSGMQQALGMAERLRNMLASERQQSDGQGQSFLAGLAASFSGSSSFGGGGRVPTETPAADLPEMDPAMRTVILGMQPRMREELLLGMRERGPEAYRQFIENYYKELTRTKDEAK